MSSAHASRAPGLPAGSADGRAWWRVAAVLFVVGWGGNQVTPMLVVYRDELGVAPAALAATFGVYAAGLVAGLLLGGRASDIIGRRAPVLALATLSPLATVVLMAAAVAPAALWPARLLAGIASGVVFAAGSAWLQDVLANSAPAAAPRRTAVALSAGFALGPLVAATLAAFVPAPLIVPYVPHLSCPSSRWPPSSVYATCAARRRVRRGSSRHVRSCGLP